MNDRACDIVIPVFNRKDMTAGCLESIVEHTESPYNIILVDNASGEETAAYLRDFASSRKNVRLMTNSTNYGWVKAVNQGMAASGSPYVCIMNNDTVVRTPGWLSKMIDVSNTSSDIGLVNPRFQIKEKERYVSGIVEMDFCRGHCILIKRGVMDKVGFFDEAYGMGYCDDDDYSAKAMSAGYRSVMANDVVVEHLGNSTFLTFFSKDKVTELQLKNKRLFASKWGRKLRILFILSGDSDRSAASRVLLALARRQHKIHIWNRGQAIGLAHTNIREKRFVLPLSRYVFSWMLRVNGTKSQSKRYDVVFCDSPKICPAVSSGSRNVFCMDPASDYDKIISVVGSISKA